MLRRITTLVLAVALSIPMSSSLAADANTLNSAVNGAAAYIYKTVKAPQVGSIGGEWAVIGLARSGYEVPKTYYTNYYRTVEQYVKATGGVLHLKKYTEYSRVILGLTAAGYDPRNVAGYDLTEPLGDFEKTIWQGINGPVWALIALDSGNYPIPQNSKAKTQATRDLYIGEILRRQLQDGGFNLTAGAGGSAIDENERADPDLTGMALQALSKYQNKAEVKAATERALECLSKMQRDNGGYASWGTVNSESAVQVLVALCELGVSIDDPRFVKGGNNLVDNILSFQNRDKSFNHTSDGSGSNQMATEQAFYGLVAAQRGSGGKNSLYRMGDGAKRGDFTLNDVPREQKESGLAGKHTDVKPVLISSPGKTFEDIQAHKNQPAIEALAARGIIGGRSDGSFDPDATMTRAEFAAIVTRGLGLSQKPGSVFADVPEGEWYTGYIGSAYGYGVVTGTSGATFDPDGTITREEAAVMAARGAKLCGMETAMSDGAVKDMLAQFTDYVTVSPWARSALAFCYQEDILSVEEIDIRPADAVKRCEVAEMLFRLLGSAKLL